MFLTILLILILVLFFLILVVLFTPIKCNIQNGPFLLVARFFFFRLKLSSNLELQISFLKIKKKIAIGRLSEEIFQKKIANILQKFFSSQKNLDIQQKTTKAKAPIQVKKNWKPKPNRLELLELSKFFFLYFSIHKIDLRIAWDSCNFLGALYGFRVLLPLTYQKKLHFSFYQRSSFQLGIHFYLGRFLLQTFYWYCKLFLKSKNKKI